MKTQADVRFLRAAWERPMRAGQGKVAWVPLYKGGSQARYYGDVHLLIDWRDNGKHPRAAYEAKAAEASWGGFGRNERFYFRPGLAWPRRTSGLAFRVLPGGCIFADKGPALFVTDEHRGALLALSAVANSRVFAYLVSLQLARTELAQSYEVGLIRSTPVPDLTASDQEVLAALANRAWSVKRSLDTRTEISHAFAVPALLQVDGGVLSERAAAWTERVEAVDSELAAIQAEIDERCFDLYGIEEEDRRAITEGFGVGTGEDGEVDGEAEAEADEDDSSVELTALAAELVSWAVGVGFGRFDVRLATGERALPAEPEPFDPLPVCSPGMLAGEDGLPSTEPPAGYQLEFPADGVLVDDPGHPRDLTAAARAVFELVFGEGADARWQEAAALLDPKNHDLRGWLTRRFFAQHLKGYSKSRRKAPILWQLGTASASYSVWLYAHRLTKDSLYQVLNDLVAPKLSLEERKQTTLTQTAGPNPTASQRKEIAAQEAFVEELRVLKEELGRVAALWNPDLNDGVVLTMAPLWRLVPQHKPWQRELKAAWKSLGEGKYDWSHLAMQLWPERVVPKCATDRSLAIAHGLEDSFWIANDDSEWEARREPTKPVEELVAERASAGVKAALDGLEGATPK